MAGRLTGRAGPPFVTGGSAGIGQEIARRLAAEGAGIAVADVDPADETRELVYLHWSHVGQHGLERLPLRELPPFLPAGSCLS